MLKVGLTGGIGSGKSTVARIFEILGVPVFYSDRVGREVLSGSDVLQQVARLLDDPDIVDESGRPNRQRIAAGVFGNDEKLKALNALIHPKVRKLFNLWCDRHQDCAYVINEAAILFETGSYSDLDRNILVTAPEDLRIRRVMKRDGVSRSDVEKRLSKQWPDKRKAKLADEVIENDNNHSLIRQVLAIHRALEFH